MGFSELLNRAFAGVGSIIRAPDPAARRRAAGPPPLGPAQDVTTGPEAAGDGWGTFRSGALGFLSGCGPRPVGGPTTYRSCLRDPVLAMARGMALEPIKANGPRIQSRDGAPKRWKAYVEKVTRPLLSSYAEDAVRGVDFGNALFQNDWDRKNGRYVLDRVMLAKPEASGVIIDDDKSAKPIGVRWNGADLYGHKAFFYCHDREGLDWRGRSRLENVIDAIWGGRGLTDKAGRAVNKVSGTKFGVGYPPGDGKEAQAEAFARQMVDAESAWAVWPLAGGLSLEDLRTLIRSDPAKAEKAMGLTFWDHKTFDFGNLGPALDALLQERRYLDELKCHGYGVPPRAVLSGETGTFSSTESASSSGTAVNETVNRGIWHAFNQGPVNSLLVLEFGEGARDAVWWEPQPLEDQQAIFDRTVIPLALSSANPDVQAAVGQRDWAAVFERQGVPKLPAEELAKRDAAKAAQAAAPGAVGPDGQPVPAGPGAGPNPAAGGTPDAIDSATSLDELEAALAA